MKVYVSYQDELKFRNVNYPYYKVSFGRKAT
jgi:hypothetical protein